MVAVVIVIVVAMVTLLFLTPDVVNVVAVF